MYDIFLFQAGHVCGDDMDIINGHPTGSVRISFGYMSTKADADHFLEFIKDCFIKPAISSNSNVESDMKSDLKVLLAVSSKSKVELDVKSDPKVSPVSSSKSKVELNVKSDQKGSMKEHDQQSQDAMLNRSSCSVSSVTLIQSGRSKIITSDENVILNSNSASQTVHSAHVDGFCGDGGVSRGAEIARHAGSEMVLTNIFLYPIKSCGAMEVSIVFSFLPRKFKGKICRGVHLAVMYGGELLYFRIFFVAMPASMSELKSCTA